MAHRPSCNWLNSDCEYKYTHEYCPHPEHNCDCDQYGDEAKLTKIIVVFEEAVSFRKGDRATLIIDPKTGLAEVKKDGK